MYPSNYRFQVNFFLASAMPANDPRVSYIPASIQAHKDLACPCLVLSSESRLGSPCPPSTSQDSYRLRWEAEDSWSAWAALVSTTSGPNSGL